MKTKLKRTRKLINFSVALHFPALRFDVFECSLHNSVTFCVNNLGEFTGG